MTRNDDNSAIYDEACWENKRKTEDKVTLAISNQSMLIQDKEPRVLKGAHKRNLFATKAKELYTSERTIVPWRVIF